MGGYGALKIAMLFPDIFASVYALSPSRLALIEEFGPQGEVFKQAQQITTHEELFKNYRANLAIAMGRALSPNPNNPPFYCDLPFSYQGDTLNVNQQVLARWNQSSPLGMIDTHAENLRKLKAIKFDWGRNDESKHIPASCRQMSKKLEALGIEHYAEEYIGTHIYKLWTADGRALNDMFPFFNMYLSYHEPNANPSKKNKKR
ncbi:MAG: alpha/beta hydrolase-fold protein [Chryseolinea sp.]